MMRGFCLLRRAAWMLRGACTAGMLAALAAGVLQESLLAERRSALFVNVKPDQAASLAKALQQNGLNSVTRSANDNSFQGAVVALEVNGDLSSETVRQLEHFVRSGGALLIGFDRHTGSGPSQLAFLSPTTAWITQSDSNSRSLSLDTIATSIFDPDLFGHSLQPGFGLSYFFPIRPVSAVERGIERYERYKINSSSGVFAHDAGVPFWTRPLMNRDWKVRLQGNDRAASPLLITGAYGAGRVAVYASCLTGDNAGFEAFWKPVVAWLAAPQLHGDDEAAPGAIELAPDAATADVAANTLHVALKNSSASPLAVQVMGRVLTWEGAFVGDTAKVITVPGNGSTSVELPMPSLASTQYQALDWRRAFVIRLGVLSRSGATLLSERRIAADFTPAVALDLSTDNLYQVTYPFASAPGIAGAGGIAPRMGSQIMQYAYRPGGEVHVTASITNGMHNLAPSATVVDVTNPQNPSIVAINDEGAQANKGPRDAFNGYGAWTGMADTENVLRFHFPTPVSVAAVTLIGAASQAARKTIEHNPGAVLIECDGRQVVRNNSMDSRFESGAGVVRLPFAAVRTTDLVVRMPWVSALLPKGRREAPWLGEIEIEGSEAPLSPEVQGEATLALHDAMSGSDTVVAKKQVSIGPGGRVEWVEKVKLPSSNAGFYQLQLRFAGETRSVPVLAINPSKTLESSASLNPPGSPRIDFLVTRGFRAEFPIGTGTRDTPPGWETPDDLIWSYSHQTNQVSAGAHIWPAWFYLSDTGMAHYSNSWGLFLNGEDIWQAAAPHLLETMQRNRNWSASRQVEFGMGDRWDSGPALAEMYGWQELVAFDEYLRTRGRLGLKGTTRTELSSDVIRNHQAEWGLWHEQRYVEDVDSLAAMFAKFGKDLVISGQGIPMTSNKDAAIVGKTVRGMSSDNTWGMEHENVPYTTGRQLGTQAYNPEWMLGFNFVWGWDSTTLDNPSWYAAVGTTEPTRRHYYDLAWRAVVNDQGKYLSSFAYGFGMNGGDAWTMGTNDYQQYWNAAERFSLLYPEQPLGAGLIVSSSLVDSPQSSFFNGGGMGGTSNADRLAAEYAHTFQRLHESGLSVSFAGNVMGMKNFRDRAPLILEDMSALSGEELGVLKGLAAGGTRIAAFRGRNLLSPEVAAFFGIAADGSAQGASAVGRAGSHVLVEHGNTLTIPFSSELLTAELSMQLAPILQRWLDLPVALPEGTMGYGFVSGGRSMVVIEDWKEQARELAVRIRATGDTAQAVSLDDHNTLAVRREGGDWVVQLPIRPGDGDVVILQQTGKPGESR